MAYNEGEYKKSLQAKNEEQYKQLLQSLGPRFQQILREETNNMIQQKVPQGLELSGGSYNPKSGLGLQFDVPEPTMDVLPPAPSGFEYGSVSGGPEGFKSYTLDKPPKEKEKVSQDITEEVNNYLKNGRRGKITITPGAKNPIKFEVLPNEAKGQLITRWQKEAINILGGNKEEYGEIAKALGRGMKQGKSLFAIRDRLKEVGLQLHHVYNIIGNYQGYRPGVSLRKISRKKAKPGVLASKVQRGTGAGAGNAMARQSGKPQLKAGAKSPPKLRTKAQLRPPTKSYPSSFAAGAARAGERAKVRVKKEGTSRMRTESKKAKEKLGKKIVEARVPRSWKGARQIFGTKLFKRG